MAQQNTSTAIKHSAAVLPALDRCANPCGGESVVFRG
jgi:hypothetical protein